MATTLKIQMKMDKMGVDMGLQGKLMSNSHKTHLSSSDLMSWDKQEAI